MKNVKCKIMVHNKLIYLDHAAATPLDTHVRETMRPYLAEQYGHPSALYELGRSARKAIDEARESVAQILNCRASEIIFTGSGTESDNLAIFGAARWYCRIPPLTPPPPGGETDTISSPARGEVGRGGRGHIATANFEHHAVLNSCKALEKDGCAVTYLKVDKNGFIAPAQLKVALRKDTILVSIMYANNEVGTIEPIVELTQVLRKWKKENRRKENDPPFFHTDACQAAGYLDMDVQKLGVDLLTLNGSKIYGPKGVGVLYIRRGIKLAPIIYGGGQEFGLRSGTENVATIVGMGKALEVARETKQLNHKTTEQLRDRLISGILEHIEKAELNGHPTQRLPNNVNVSIAGIEGEAMLFYLDEAGIAASTGSACEAAGPDPSHVIQALGKSREAARSSVRFTLGRETTAEDIDYVLDVLPKIVQKLRHK